MEQFAQSMPASIMESLGMAASSMAYSMAGGNHGNHGTPEMLLAGMMSQAAAGSYENAVNYALKAEKGLPPTPPGWLSFYEIKCF